MIKSDIINCTGIDIHPVSHEDIYLGRSREMMPDRLYKFLHWAICKDVNPYVVKNESAPLNRLITANNHVKQNGMGDCSSFEDVETVDTSIVREMIAQSNNHLGVITPSNISPGAFVQTAADNNDINEVTLYSKHTTHSTR